VFSTGLQPDKFLSTKLVNMYVTCNSLVDAHLLFEKISNRNVFCWNAILRGYTKNGMFEETLRLYHQMLKDGINPDHFISLMFSMHAVACWISRRRSFM
jgi:pentatricopeptide repeat protein